jgi:hypothetical protein
MYVKPASQILLGTDIHEDGATTYSPLPREPTPDQKSSVDQDAARNSPSPVPALAENGGELLAGRVGTLGDSSDKLLEKGAGILFRPTQSLGFFFSGSTPCTYFRSTVPAYFARIRRYRGSIHP